MAGGLITMAIGNYWMAHLNLEISPWQVVWPRVVVIAGLSMLFAPLNVAAFIYLPKEIRGPAVGLLALLRNEGGSVGTSVAQIIQERREQFHTLRLNESLDPLNPPVNTLLTRGQAFFLQHNGDAVLSHQMALGVLGQSRPQQASSMAYFDSNRHRYRGCATGYLLRICCNPPAVAGGILNASDAIAPSHVIGLSNRLGPKTHSECVSRIDIGNVDTDRGCHRGIGKVAIAKQHMCVADFGFGIRLPLGIGRRSMRHFCAERIL
jgi:hypothetical protein